MIISEEKKVIFVHIPRTGGTTIKTLFGRPDLIHQCFPASMLKQQIPDWESYYRFSFVRNPWDHIVSKYCFLAQHEVGKNYVYPGGLNDGEQFHEWVSRKFPVQGNPDGGLYRMWLCDEEGNSLVNDVFRYENFETDVRAICQKFGIDASSIPHVNQSERQSDYRSYYDQDTQYRIRANFYQDIHDYNYVF